MQTKPSLLTKFFHLLALLGVVGTGGVAVFLIVLSVLLTAKRDFPAVRNFEIEAPVRISFEAMGIPDDSSQLQTVEIDRASAVFRLSNEAGEGLGVVTLVGAGIALLACGACWQLWRLLGSLKTSHPFIPENFRRLRRFAGFVLVCSLCAPLYRLAAGVYVGRYTEGVDGLFQVVTEYRMEGKGLLFGLALLLIAEVFRIGIEMKQEQDLTV